MAKDDQDFGTHRARESVRSAWSQRVRTTVLAVTLLTGSILGVGFARHFSQAQSISDSSGLKPSALKKLFATWPTNRKPDVVLLLSGQQMGYIQPCGCSRPQLGGLERRYNFLVQVRQEKGWNVVPIDLGDVAQSSGLQATLKYVVSMKSLRAMDYAAVGLGRNEMMGGLLSTLGEYSLNEKKPPVVLSNLDNPADFPDLTTQQALATAGGVRVGILSVIAHGNGAKPLPDPTVKLAPAAKELATLLTNIQKQQPDLLVLLFHGTNKQAATCAKLYPQFNVILCTTDEEEPPASPKMMVGDTMVINIGHKGRYVGLVGAFSTGKPARPFDLYYQLAALTEDYETPPGKDASNPVLGFLEQYTRDVRDNNYLTKYPKTRHPVQIAFPKAEYVGSQKCKSCHPNEFRIWRKSPHATAFASLITAKRPSLRQFDGECVKCHVTGFEHVTGYTNSSETKLLENNGCENCHGPGSIHVDQKNPDHNSPALYKLMNPFKTPARETAAQQTIRLRNLDISCQKCHDVDNDVHWNFNKKWVKIAH